MNASIKPFALRPISGVGIAEICGLDCARPLEPEVLDALNAAFLEYPVLVIRDQHLEPAQQRRFSEQFGPLEDSYNSKFAHPDDPQVLIVSNEMVDPATAIGLVDAGDYQHSDGQSREIPCFATILYSVRNPSRGGDTEYANMYMVYDALPEDVKRQIDGRTAENHVSKSKNKRTAISASRPGAREFYDEQAARPSVHHPIVRTHPQTGRRALYISPRFTLRIDGIDEAESDRLLELLFTQMKDERFTYRHRWALHDLVIWDNRCMTHRATGGYRLPDIRRMHRTVVRGNDRPSFRPN